MATGGDAPELERREMRLWPRAWRKKERESVCVRERREADRLAGWPAPLESAGAAAEPSRVGKEARPAASHRALLREKPDFPAPV